MPSILPVHPQPLPGELFSSWVHRVARANGQNVFSLCYLLAPEMKNTYYNCDYVVDEGVVFKFAKVLRASREKAYRTTLESFAGYLFEQATPKAHIKTCILQTGIKRYDDVRFNLQFCPACLSEGCPYFRKKWRISWLTVCTEHACQLHDRCPECNFPVRPLKNDVGQPHKMPFLGKITECFQCGFELKDSTAKRANLEVLSDAYWYEEALNLGYISLTERTWIYSFSLFSVLRHLIYLIGSGSSKGGNPDTMPHEFRYNAMRELRGVFRDWPNRLIELCNRRGIKYYHFTNMTKRKPLLPYWLDAAIRPRMYKPKLGPTKESVAAAIAYLRTHEIRTSLLQVNRILGYRDSGLIKKFYKEIHE